MERTVIVMQQGNRHIRFDVGTEDVIVTGAKGRATKQALAPIDVAREFVDELMEKEWERNEELEKTLQRGFKET